MIRSMRCCALLLAGLHGVSISSAALEVSSPDGALVVHLAEEGGSLTYHVELSGEVMVEPSPLGLETSLGSFATDLRLLGSEETRIEEDYVLTHGKVREIDYVANELTARLETAEGHRLEILFRVSDRDVAFAYRLSSDSAQRVTITDEATGFDLPATATAFVTPQARAGDGWMKTKPSYEEGYLLDVSVDTPSPIGLGFTFPALFRVDERGWVLVSETGVSSRYAGTRLSDPTAQGLYRIAFPEEEENGGIGDATVSGSLPLLTPWRTLTVGRTLAPIVESTVATDVVKPLYAPSMDYLPGRSTWSWLVWQDPSMNAADQRTFVDLAADLGYEYILVDALWDTQLGRDGLEALVDYAREHRVGVILWYNSNGAWNDAPQGPRNRMDTAPARQAEMAWLQSIGVKGLKVDFFGGDKQTTMKLYEDLLTDANAHGLMLNFHGTTLPRGWERMYPNFMTGEAALVSENLVFSQDFTDGEATWSTILPFTRGAVAPLDFGPVLLNEVYSRDQQEGSVRRTTVAFQLATAVLYQSPLQHFGLTPNNLTEQPPFVIDFMKEVPVVWDETRYIDGFPGRLAVLARRLGNDWYVVATNGAQEAQTLSLVAPFLAGETFTLISDGPDGSPMQSQLTVDDEGRFELRLAVGGGAVLYQ
ncbi:MAG: glycoside hydrolase family 97 catalytic domain-containing protein [Verrucomicrobiota bacterium]